MLYMCLVKVIETITLIIIDVQRIFFIYVYRIKDLQLSSPLFVVYGKSVQGANVLRQILYFMLKNIKI